MDCATYVRVGSSTMTGEEAMILLLVGREKPYDKSGMFTFE